MRRRVWWAYLVFVHAILVLALVKPGLLSRLERRFGFGAAPEITDHFVRMVSYHDRMDGNVPAGAVVFIGASHVQGLFTDAVAMPSVNYGIGGDTTVGLLSRLSRYRCLDRAAAVVLAIGMNDLARRDNTKIVANYQHILRALPPALPTVVTALFPVDAESMTDPLPGVSNARIAGVNRALAGLCATDPRCAFLDIGASLADKEGNLSKANHVGDGVHLNNEGYRIWIEALKTVLLNVRQGLAAPEDR
jgi:lysophospholipase L1-like esterase